MAKVLCLLLLLVAAALTMTAAFAPEGDTTVLRLDGATTIIRDAQARIARAPRRAFVPQARVNYYTTAVNRITS